MQPFTTLAPEIASLKRQIAKAERTREIWRAANWQENYLASCSTVDALGLQLDLLERAERRAARESAAAAVPDLLVAPLAAAP